VKRAGRLLEPRLIDVKMLSREEGLVKMLVGERPAAAGVRPEVSVSTRHHPIAPSQANRTDTRETCL